MFNPALVSPFPVRYEPRFEHLEDDDKAGHVNAAPGEGTHTKSLGLLRGELQVLTGLPPVLAHGLFSTAMAFPIVMRLSTLQAGPVEDNAQHLRGLDIKVIGAEGARLPGSEGDVTQDFVMANAPAFAARHAQGVLKSLKQLAEGGDKAPTLKKKVFSAVARSAEKVIESVGRGEHGVLKGLGGHLETHILGEAFYSQVPLLYGPYMAKLSVVPISPGLTILKNIPLDLHDKPDGLRDAVVDFFSSHSGEWELRVQLCTDIEAMPIDDACAVWPEEQSASLAVARITVPPQRAWSEARAALVDNTYAFTPWHGLAAHRPLGSAARHAHKAVHHPEASINDALGSHHGQGLQEPRSLEALPD